MDGVTYNLNKNDPAGPNAVHGGVKVGNELESLNLPYFLCFYFDFRTVIAKDIYRNIFHFQAFDKRVWNSSMGSSSVSFSYLSPDGEEGYPGKFFGLIIENIF